MNKLITVFKIPELRLKIGITLLFLCIYRIGFHVPLPFINQEEMVKQSMQQGALGQILSYISVFSGGNFSQSTIFGLGIMPYISASIIFQLMAEMYAPLQKLKKEGASGQKKINEYTRYATVLVCVVQAFMWVQHIMRPKPSGLGLAIPGYEGLWYILAAVLTMTAGTIFLMWLGEQIDEYGIGNGISLIIMAGIISRIPQATSMLLIDPSTNRIKDSILTLGGGSSGHDVGFEKLLVLACLFVGVVMAIVAITNGQRKIPTQSAKHVRGRRVFGGTRQYLPLRVNQAGVMPVIFASSLLMLPYFAFTWLHGITQQNWAGFIADAFLRMGYTYNLFYSALIYFFCYFWTAITFNPKDMADNLKDYGSFIPGYRPGKRTADYLERVLVRITYVGAAFLALVAVIPTAIQGFLNIDFVIASFFGGTGLLIVVSVGLDLVQKIDSHLVMRNYGGLTED